MRKIGSLVLIVLGCLLAIPALASTWLDREITNTDRYVSTVVPLVEQPAVQQAVATRVGDAILDRVGTQRSAVETVVRAAVDRVVRSDAFEGLWRTVNQTVQPQLVRLLRGETSAMRIEGDAIVLDLGPIAAAAQADLVAGGHQFAANLPPVDATFQLYSSTTISTAQRAFQLLEKLSTWLPIVGIGLLLIGVLIAPDRWRALVWIGLGLAAAMLLLALIVWFGRRQALDAAQSPDAMGVIYDAFTKPLKNTLWWTFGLGALIGVGTLLWRRRAAQVPPTGAGPA